MAFGLGRKFKKAMSYGIIPEALGLFQKGGGGAPGESPEERDLRMRQIEELGTERDKQNELLKRMRMGKFGARSLLSGSFAGIQDEGAARAALGGTTAGRSVSRSLFRDAGSRGSVGAGGGTARFATRGRGALV